MRTPKRDFEMFSLSAMDLFCSAMGAFIVICIALFPFYRKTSTTEEVLVLKEQIKRMEGALQQTITLAALGITSKSDSFVLVVDLSGSMEKYTEIMMRTCDELIRPMKDTHTCQIIGFHSPQWPPSLPRWQPGNTLVPMNAGNKRAASDYIKGLMGQVNGGTPTREAMREALQTPAKAIFLITDGAPSDQNTRPGPGYIDQVIQEITQANGGRAEIHCIAIGDYGDDATFTKFLTELAKANNGIFLGVSK